MGAPGRTGGKREPGNIPAPGGEFATHGEIPGDHSCSEWRSYSMGTIQGNKTQELRRGSGRVIPRSSNALVRLCGSSMFFVQIAAVVSRI